MEAKVFSTPTCPYCHQVKHYLQQRGIPFRDLDVSQDALAAQEMVRVSGQQGVPVTVIGDQVIVGFDRPRLDQILARAAQPRLGAAVADAAQMAAQGRSPFNQGAYVGRVSPGGAAEGAGLSAGDVIVALGGQPVQDAGQLERLMSQVRPGQHVPVTYLRQGRRLEATLSF